MVRFGTSTLFGEMFERKCIQIPITHAKPSSIFHKCISVVGVRYLWCIHLSIDFGKKLDAYMDI